MQHPSQPANSLWGVAQCYTQTVRKQRPIGITRHYLSRTRWNWYACGLRCLAVTTATRSPYSLSTEALVARRGTLSLRGGMLFARPATPPHASVRHDRQAGTPSGTATPTFPRPVSWQRGIMLVNEATMLRAASSSTRASALILRTAPTAAGLWHAQLHQ